MTISKVMWSTTFRIFSHPCPVADVMCGLCVDMSALEFVVGIAYTIDLLAVLLINSVPAIAVDTLANENVNGLAAVMTPFEFTLPAP